MTFAEFRDQHPYSSWSSADFETAEVLARTERRDDEAPTDAGIDAPASTPA